MSTPTEESKLITKPIFHSQPLAIDERMFEICS
jgi:hypothetical protein